ncbi:glutaminase [Actinokineospora alba]|uniref:glutaminase n=1 Tax=Actinokineospora alba TaxID=504798 RepID=UPI001E5437A9|nr:glutaminase [Actinokineospora alba]
MGYPGGEATAVLEPAPRPFLRTALDEVCEQVQPLVDLGQSTVESHGFGMAVATVDGELCGVGDYQVPFPLRSLAKVFGFALAHAVDSRPGPQNPFDPLGALVTTDRLLSRTGDAAGALRAFLAAQSGNHSIADEPAGTSANSALAQIIAGSDVLDNPVSTVVDHFNRQGAIAMTCADLATAALFLARGGVGADGTRLLAREATRRLNAIMLVCGMYDGAGEFAYRVGLPAKSGSGGGIIAVVPNRCVVCVWSPGLDACGNSVAGVAALEAFSTVTGWSVF